MLIGVDRSAGFHAATDDRLHADLGAVGDRAGTYLSATFEHPHHDSFATTALPHIRPLFAFLVHVPRLAADEGFVYFNLTPQASAGQIVLHCESHAVE